MRGARAGLRLGLLAGLVLCGSACARGPSPSAGAYALPGHSDRAAVVRTQLARTGPDEAPRGPAATPPVSAAPPEEGAAEEPASEPTSEPAGDEEAPGPDAWDPDAALEDDWLDVGPTPAERDPLEPMNRRIHGVNEVMHRFVLGPVADAYEWAVPGPGRRAIYRLFENLGEPVSFVNHVLQLAPVDAGTTGARFVLNSTVGLAGLFDPAERVGLERRTTDFGQTLAVYRVESGPYLVLPVLGPSTARDAFGELVDAALRPDLWLLGAGIPFYSLAAGEGLAIYEVQSERMEALRESSIDFYSALRAAYLMNRDARVAARIERVCGPEALEEEAASPEEARGPAASAGGPAPAAPGAPSAP